MKKLIFFLLSLFAVSFVSCGPDDDKQKPEQEQVETDETRSPPIPPGKCDRKK